MMRVDPLLETNAIENFEAFLDAFPELAIDVVNDAFRRDIEPDLLDELQYTPGPSLNSLNSSQPFVWSLDPEANARARRWWFANFPEGRERTGALNAAYEVDIVQGDDLIAMSVRNTAKHHKWVKGKRQIPGHARTGWQKDKPTIDFWAQAAGEVITEAVLGLVEQAKF